MTRLIKLISGPVRLGALVMAAVTPLAIPQAHAANIISFDDNATGCGGAVLCATDGNATTGGTHGYNGTNPFSITTINSWFQVDAATSHIAGQPAQPANAGDFLVVNNTGAPLTSLTLTITDTFDATTPSAHPCAAATHAGMVCVNFQANKGATNPPGATEFLSGPDLDLCTNGNLVGGACVSTAGSAAADFAPNMVTYNWTGYNIPAGGTFDIDFASWNNAAFTTPQAPPIPEPGTLALLGSALMAFGIARRRKSV